MSLVLAAQVPIGGSIGVVWLHLYIFESVEKRCFLLSVKLTDGDITACNMQALGSFGIVARKVR